MNNLLTVKFVKELLKDIGFSCNRTQGGDFRVAEHGAKRDEGYFTTDLDDALSTAVLIHQNRIHQYRVESIQRNRRILSAI